MRTVANILSYHLSLEAKPLVVILGSPPPHQKKKYKNKTYHLRYKIIVFYRLYLKFVAGVTRFLSLI